MPPPRRAFRAVAGPAVAGMSARAAHIPPPPPWPEGTARIVLDETDSTNAEASRRAAAGTLAGPTWILARRQSAGRGRRGRLWRGGAGNFAATLYLPLAEPPARLALRSFVAALAVDDALLGLGLPQEAFGLKWPNDVLLRGGKLCGILLESLAGQGLAIGIGLNLQAAPDVPEAEEGAALPPASLAAEGGLAGIGPEDFLARLAPAFARREAQFRRQGFAPIRQAWLGRALRLGRPIRVRSMGEDLRGIFETVDGQGRLVLSTPEGRHLIAAADVFFPREG